MISDLKFLVVEDHSLQRRVMLNILESLGTTNPLQAGDGRSALKLLAESRQRVDIVISDLDMPGMDGIEFIRHLEKLKSRVSIILASAVGSAVMVSVEAMARAYGIHLLGVVEKPVAAEKLKTLLAKHRLRPGPVVARPAQRDYSVDEIAQGLRDNQFEPFFQPKVEFASGRVTGFEALARWRHPHNGIVTPSAFVQTMEESGLVNELTWCILELGCDLAQGYFVARPMEAGCVADWTMQWDARQGSQGQAT